MMVHQIKQATSTPSRDIFNLVNFSMLAWATASMHKVYHSFSNIICDVAPSQIAHWFLNKT